MRWLERRRREHDDELLSAYIDGQLLGRARQEFEARLAREPELRARLEAMRRMLGLMRSLPTVPAPRNFILDPARYGRPAHVRRVARWYPALRLATTLATALLILVFAADLIIAQALTPASRTIAPLAAPQIATAGQEARQKTDRVGATVPPAPEGLSAPAPTAAPLLAAQPTLPPGEADQLPPAAEGEQAPVMPAPTTRLGPSAQGADAGGLETGEQPTPGPTGPEHTPTPEAPAATPTPVPATPAEVGQAPPQAPPLAPGQPPQESTSLYTQEGAPQPPVPTALLRAIEIGLAVLVILLVGATILAWRAT